MCMSAAGAAAVAFGTVSIEQARTSAGAKIRIEQG